MTKFKHLMSRLGEGLRAAGVLAVIAGAAHAEPVTLNVVDVAGNLALTQEALESFAAKNPNLVSRITFTKAPAPELPGKLKALQAAGRTENDDWRVLLIFRRRRHLGLGGKVGLDRIVKVLLGDRPRFGQRRIAIDIELRLALVRFRLQLLRVGLGKLSVCLIENGLERPRIERKEQLSLSDERAFGVVLCE